MARTSSLLSVTGRAGDSGVGMAQAWHRRPRAAKGAARSRRAALLDVQGAAHRGRAHSQAPRRTEPALASPADPARRGNGRKRQTWEVDTVRAVRFGEHSRAERFAQSRML